MQVFVDPREGKMGHSPRSQPIFAFHERRRAHAHLRETPQLAGKTCSTLTYRPSSLRLVTILHATFNCWPSSIRSPSCGYPALASASASCLREPKNFRVSPFDCTAM